MDFKLPGVFTVFLGRIWNLLTGGVIQTSIGEKENEVIMSTIPERTQQNVSQPVRPVNNTGEGTGDQIRPAARPAYERRRKALAKWTQVGALLIITLESALAFRVLFKLIAANPANPFAHLLYGVTQPFAAPFFGLVGMPAFNGSVFEISTLIGMTIYGAVYWIIIRLLWVIFNPTKAIDADKYEPDL